MRWILKAATQKAISALPNPEVMNYFFQSKITNKLPANKERFLGRVAHAIEHFNAIRKRWPESDLGSLRGYEFGAGWDMIIPLSYYALGINHQTIVDIRSNFRAELVNDTIRRLTLFRPEIEPAHGITLRPLCPDQPMRSPGDLRQFGIQYRAPCDATSTGLPAADYDFITSTYTLEHIPRPVVVAIMRECHRILKPSGIVSSLIDMQDHYNGFDKSISVYNYLKFPGWVWSLANSSLHYQNRMRLCHYLSIFSGAGFTPVSRWIDQPTDTDWQKFSRISKAREFRGLPDSDVAAKRLGLVMEKIQATKEAGEVCK